jgi:hypothetical protein
MSPLLFPDLCLPRLEVGNADNLRSDDDIFFQRRIEVELANLIRKNVNRRQKPEDPSCLVIIFLSWVGEVGAIWATVLQSSLC